MKRELASAAALANLLENRFSIAGFRFGIDAIIDLLPFSGDTIILALSFYLVLVGIRIGLPAPKLREMVWNILISFAVGLVPILGEVSYLAFRPNIRNLAILEEHARRTESES